MGVFEMQVCLKLLFSLMRITVSGSDLVIQYLVVCLLYLLCKEWCNSVKEFKDCDAQTPPIDVNPITILWPFRPVRF